MTGSIMPAENAGDGAARRRTAYLFMLVTVACFPGMDGIAKYLSQSLPVLEIVWVRYTGQFLFILIWFSPKLSRVWRTRHPVLQITRSALLFLATCLFFVGLKYLEQGFAMAVFQVAPLIIAVLAVLFLGERIGPRRLASLAGGFIGALIIIQPLGASFSLYSLLPFGAATCFACFSILTRVLGNSEASDTTLLYTAGVGAIGSAVFLPFVFEMPQSATEIMLLLLVPLLAGVGHYTLVRAMTMTEASDLAPLNYLSLVFALVWGFLLFAEIPAASTLSGAAIIVLSGLYLWWRARQERKQAAS